MQLRIMAACGILALGLSSTEAADELKKYAGKPVSVHDFTVDLIDGTRKPLSDYKGKVLLVVNVASKCGYTKQYSGLEALYLAYASQGLVVLGFPANNFMGQEPGTNEEIATFCSTRFNVTFPMFAKISVGGDDIHPLYRFLTDEERHGKLGGKITWNFNKFLVDGDGKLINRFGTRVDPDAPEIKHAIEEALKKHS